MSQYPARCHGCGDILPNNGHPCEGCGGHMVRRRSPFVPGEARLECPRPVPAADARTTAMVALGWILADLDAADEKEVDAPASAEMHRMQAKGIAAAALEYLESLGG